MRSRPPDDASPPPTCPPIRRRNLASAFRSAVVNSRETDAASLAPVRQLGEASLVYLRASNVYLLAVTKRNSNAMMIMQFLSRVGAGWMCVWVVGGWDVHASRMRGCDARASV